MKFQLLAQKKLERKLELIKLVHENKNNVPEDSVSGIYCIYSVTLNKIYIGKSTNTLKRLKAHKAALISKRHVNTSLQRAFNKYGESDFIGFLLHSCSIDDLSNYEASYIKFYKSNKSEYGFNLRKESLQ